MKNSRSFAVKLLLFVLVAAAGLWLGIKTRPPQDDGPPKAAQTRAGDSAGTPAAPKTGDIDRSPDAVLNRLLARLRASAPVPGELDIFREVLLQSDPRQTLAAIRRFLATGQDALTSETFAVGPNGELSGAPTLRILLLDMLGRISREEKTADGGEAARAILQKKPSESTPDEWAIALRNAAWAQPSDTAYLTEKTRELINDPLWRMRPTAGYYEAFDLIVYTRDVGSIATLADMVRGEDEDAKVTAATTLDRLAAMAPLDVMTYLNQNPAELSDKPYLRSDYYGKADFTQPAQREAVEAYLDRTDVDARAKGKVIATLGQPGVFVSENLLTETPAPVDDIPPLQRTALQNAVKEWLLNNRYPSLRPALLAKQEGLGN